MLIKEYRSEDERNELIIEHADLILVEERNIAEGNFLVFSEEPIPERIVYMDVPKDDFERLKQENVLLKAQAQANADQADFHEELIVELAMEVYK